MSVAGAVFLVAGFLALIKIFRLIEKSADAIDTAKLALKDLQNSELDDHSKEKVLQSHSLRLFTLFFVITLGIIAAISIPVGIIWFFDRLNWMSMETVFDTTLSWEFILASTVFSVLFLWLAHK